MLSFPLIQSTSFNFLKYYEDSVNYLVSKRFIGMKLNSDKEEDAF